MDPLEKLQKTLDLMHEQLEKLILRVESLESKEHQNTVANAQMRNMFKDFIDKSKAPQESTSKSKKDSKLPPKPKSLDLINPSQKNPNGAMSVFIKMCKDPKTGFAVEIANIAYEVDGIYKPNPEWVDYKDIFNKYFDPDIKSKKVPKEYKELRNKYLDEYEALNAEEEPEENNSNSDNE